MCFAVPQGPVHAKTHTAMMRRVSATHPVAAAPHTPDLPHYEGGLPWSTHLSTRVISTASS